MSAVKPSLKYPGLEHQPDEGASGVDGPVVLSDRGWRERFNADPTIVGCGVIIDGRAQTIVGVAGPRLHFPDRDTMLWTPLNVERPSPDAVAGRRGRMSVIVALARLRPGVTPAQAEAGWALSTTACNRVWTSSGVVWPVTWTKPVWTWRPRASSPPKASLSR